MKVRNFLVLLAASTAAQIAAAQGGCQDVEPPASGWIFRRQATCAEEKERGECIDLTEQGYCLLTCGACPQEQSVQETSPESVAETGGDLDEEAAQAAAYQNMLLEEAAKMEDEMEVEELPALIYDKELPGDADDNKAPVGEPVVPSCVQSSALDALKANNLTSTVAAASSINVQSVLSDQSIQYTLFAPTDSAWNSTAETLGVESLEELLEDTETTKALVFSHLIPDLLITDLAEDGTSLEALSGAVIFVGDRGKELVSRAATAGVEKKIVGCNWVIYVVDNVLGEEARDGGVNEDFEAILRG